MAGRIPQSFIDDLLNRVDIVDLIDGYVPLKKAGANYKACCPFHNEKSASFTVSPTKQFYHCFGCGANGSAIGFLMEYDHMEFVEAIEKLASQVGLEVPREEGAGKRPLPRKQGIDLYQLMTQSSEFYQQQLRQHQSKQQAVDYLKRRGLSGEIAKRFGLGFAPDGWDNLLQAYGSSDTQKKALVDAGMLTSNDKGRTYDRFRHRIMFPIMDHRGRTVGFGGRVLGDGEPKYLNSPETPIFHKGSELYNLFSARGAIKNASGVLVVEGYMDVVALAQYGIDNTVATLGTATTRIHLQRLFRHTETITFCFDGDRAGKAAAWKALETCLPLMDDGYAISFLFLPDGEDPDSMVQKVGTEGFIKLMTEATPLTDFLIDHLSQQADLSRLDGRAKLASLAKPLTNQLPDGVLKKLVLERLSQLTQVSASDLLASNKQAAAQPQQAQQRQVVKKRPARSAANSAIPMTPIRRAISLLLQHPDMHQQFTTLAKLEDSHIKGLDLFKSLLKICQQSAVTNTASLLENFRQQPYYDALKQLAMHKHGNLGESEHDDISSQEIEGLIGNTIALIMSEYTQQETLPIEQELAQLQKKASSVGLSDVEQQRQAELTEQYRQKLQRN